MNSNANVTLPRGTIMVSANHKILAEPYFSMRIINKLYPRLNAYGNMYSEEIIDRMYSLSDYQIDRYIYRSHSTIILMFTRHNCIGTRETFPTVQQILWNIRNINMG